jgi:hypothetical protein
VPRVHTHYDNLKVSRDAPIEVIRAAYKSLAAKFHPDLNSGSAKAAQIMRIINASYKVLADPNDRSEHDRWIERVESERADPSPRPQAPSPGPSHSSRTDDDRPPHFYTTPDAAQPSRSLKVIVMVFAAAILLGVLGSLIGRAPLRTATSSVAEPRAVPAPVDTNSGIGGYIRPTVAPTMAPWPSASDYVLGFQKLNNRGRSSLTVDNI